MHTPVLLKEVIETLNIKKNGLYVDATFGEGGYSKAILEKGHENYEATVLIDGLGRTERWEVASGLRRLHVKVRKVRGMNDQSSSIMRLADSMAGFIRNCLEGDKRFIPLYEQAIKLGIIKELK